MFSAFRRMFLSETVEIALRCAYCVLRPVIAFFGPDVHNKTDREQVEIRNGNLDLRAPLQKERRGQLTFGLSQFFLALASVKRFDPHISRISGRIS